MKSASLLVILFFSISFVTFTSILVEAVAAQDPVIVGKWDRTDGVDVYTIYANHVTETIIEGQTYRGTWENDGADGYKYIFRWEHSPPGQAPFIDYVTVSTDGQSYSGVNNYGDDFHCVRIGDAQAAESGGFPIVPVAVGGGIAAVAAIGAAAYWHFSPGKTTSTPLRRRFSLSSRGEKLRPKQSPETSTHTVEKPDGKKSRKKKGVMTRVNTGWGDSVQVVPTTLDPSVPPKLQGSKLQIDPPRSKLPESSQSVNTQTSGESTGSGKGSESSGSESSSE